jgi:hypothetical protein
VPSSSHHDTLQRIITVLEDVAAPRLATLLEADIQQAMGQLMSELLSEPLTERQLVDRLESCFSVDRRLAGLKPLEGCREVRCVCVCVCGGWSVGGVACLMSRCGYLTDGSGAAAMATFAADWTPIMHACLPNRITMPTLPVSLLTLQDPAAAAAAAAAATAAGDSSAIASSSSPAGSSEEPFSLLSALPVDTLRLKVLPHVSFKDTQSLRLACRELRAIIDGILEDLVAVCLPSDLADRWARGLRARVEGGMLWAKCDMLTMVWPGSAEQPC